jgi:predicted HTH transcriptional regulator
MTEQALEEILAKGEGINVEFKEAKENLPKTLFESICAFLNTEGGKILLGVGDDGTVSGVDPDRIQKQKIDLANLTNNPQKLDPVFMLSALWCINAVTRYMLEMRMAIIKHGYTLAAALFFGTDETIQSIVPAYKFDALLRRRDVDRYDDRLIVRTNLIDAYDLLMGFIAKHLDDPFYLEGDVRISLRDKIFRELVSNIIAHREYLDGRPATMIIYRDKVVFTNPNNPREKGIIDPSRFTPFPKNPTISKFMIQLGRVEEVGSGIRNVNKYLPLYATGGKSEFIEDELFVTNVHLGNIQETTHETIQETVKENPKVKKLVVNCIGEMTGKQLMSAMNLKNRIHFLKEYLQPAIESGLIEMTIPNQPKNRNQKYRLTAKGEALRKILKNQ